MSSFPNWTVASVLSETLRVDEKVSKNIVRMLDEGNTVPFIARYRKEKTNNMEPKEIHVVKEKYDELKKLEESLTKLRVQIDKMGQLTPVIETALKNCKSEENFSFIAEPFKNRGSKTLAQRAREKGLEPVAVKILERPQSVDIVKDVPLEVRNEGPDKIEENICYIISDIIAKNMEVLQFMDSLLERYPARLECKKVRSSSKQEKLSESEVRKFENYFDYTISVRNIKSFQVLAINRGETKKILTVKVELHAAVKEKCLQFCRQKFGTSTQFKLVVEKAAVDAYSRLICPHFTRSIRVKLKKKAFTESLALFSDNLRQLLMTSPVRGKSVLGVDPGFSHGCKMAMIGTGGDVMDTGVFNVDRPHDANRMLETLLKRHACELIALGDGVASRKVEQLLSNLIKSGRLKPLNVRYCIVSECGASVYSAGALADKELGWLDVTIRGAVSIARRLQDPLSELTKIPPSNLGVGQYQHDLPERQLEAHVSAILEECISLVGVDLNYAPVHVLEHVAGLNKARANAIFDHRRLRGDFASRDELTRVKGIGPMTFKQCAGFVRILPPEQGPAVVTVKDDSDVEMTPVEELPRVEAKTTGKAMKRKMRTPQEAVERKKAGSGYCLLDSTTVHPESYGIAKRLIDDLSCSISDIGSIRLREASRCARLLGKTATGRKLEEYVSDEKGVQTVVDILESLEKPIQFDPREDLFKPMFRACVESIESLSVGLKVSGRVTNVTQFGAFVDIGVGTDALLHSSKMGNLPALAVNSRIEAVVERLDIQRQRIGLWQAKLT